MSSTEGGSTAEEPTRRTDQARRRRLADRRLFRDFRAAPWLLAPVGVLFAMAVGRVGGIVSAFGLPGRGGTVHFGVDLFLQAIAAQGSIYALALLVALGIAAFGERSASGSRPLWEWLRAATIVAAAVRGAAAIAYAINQLSLSTGLPSGDVGRSAHHRAPGRNCPHPPRRGRADLRGDDLLGSGAVIPQPTRPPHHLIVSPINLKSLATLQDLA